MSWKAPHFHRKSTAYLRHSGRRGAPIIPEGVVAAVVIRLAKSGRSGVSSGKISSKGSPHEGGCCRCRDPEARGSRVPHRVSGQHHHRSVRAGRHPHDHRQAGAHRPAHGGRGQPGHLGRPDRRLRHAARARHRERVRRRGPGLRRLRPHPGHAGRLPAAHRGDPAQLQLDAQLPQCHEVGGVRDARRHHPGRDAAGLHPGQERAPAPRPGGVSRRPLERGRGGAPQLQAGAPDALGAGSQGRGGGRARARRRAAAGDLRGPGRALREGVAAAPPARRAARGAGDDEPAGQERVSGEPPALPRLGRPVDLQAAPSLPDECGRHLRHRLQLHADELRRGHAEGQGHDPGDARSRRPRQGHPDRSRPHRRRRAHARRAHRRGEGPAQGQAARPARRRDQGDRDAQGRVDGQVDAAAHADLGAAVAVPRDLGPDAHGGRREHASSPTTRAARAISSRRSGSRPRR